MPCSFLLKIKLVITNYWGLAVLGLFGFLLFMGILKRYDETPRGGFRLVIIERPFIWERLTTC